MNKDVILAILNMVLVYGVPAVIEMFKILGKDNITLEDIKELETRIKKPEEYFTQP